MGSFRSPLSRRPRSAGNGSVQQCGDHCDCCEIRTTEETYTVSIKNCNPGSKVNVGDNVKVYRAENLAFNAKDNIVVQLEREASLHLVDEIVKRFNEGKDAFVNLEPPKPEIPQDWTITDVLSKLTSLVGRTIDRESSFPLEIDGSAVVEPTTVTTDSCSVQVEQLPDPGNGTEQEKTASSIDDGYVMFQIHRSTKSKVPKARRRRINGVILSICGAFCTLPVAIVIIFFVLNYVQNNDKMKS